MKYRYNLLLKKKFITYITTALVFINYSGNVHSSNMGWQNPPSLEHEGANPPVTEAVISDFGQNRLKGAENWEVIRKHITVPTPRAEDIENIRTKVLEDGRMHIFYNVKGHPDTQEAIIARKKGIGSKQSNTPKTRN